MNDGRDDDDENDSTHDGPQNAKPSANACLPFHFSTLPAIDLGLDGVEPFAEFLDPLSSRSHSLLERVDCLDLVLEAFEVFELLPSFVIQARGLSLKLFVQIRCGVC